MILVDKALEERASSGNAIAVALVGAGFSGRHLTHQIITSLPGIRLVAICNRDIEKAAIAFSHAGAEDVRTASNGNDVQDAAIGHYHVVTDDIDAICGAEAIEAVIETTGSVLYGLEVALKVLESGKHLILVNAELDATFGPLLNAKARKAGLVYSNCDGDEPGVAMNLIRYVRSIGLTPVVAGNLKGLYDPYRNPETQREFAERVGQDPAKIASFADGTKLSMELCVLANATGFRVAVRGMHGPRIDHVNDSANYFAAKLLDGGMVDFLVGATPGTGAFVLAHTDDQVKKKYLGYLKLGEGPLYPFYRPFHLPQMEAPLTVARAVLFSDAAAAPIGGPVCDVVAVAKRDLKTGDRLDGLGGFACYSQLDNYDAARDANALPIGISDGLELRRNVDKDHVVTYADVVIPDDRFCDQMRQCQHEMFAPASG